MAKENISDKRFNFLHSHIAREPHIYEVLNEIVNFQNNASKTGIGHFATLDDLRTSRNIKIPSSLLRNKTITTLVDILTKNYPDEVKSLITFIFIVEPETKKLSITENREYAIHLTTDELNRLQAERNRLSADNFLILISQFRLFNLTKMIRKVRERALLSQIIKSELGISLFTFKNYSIDRKNMEIVEDFCFHKDNYESVKKTLGLDKIRAIIHANQAQIDRRLKKFGILNSDFSDYRDTKLDYLLNILIQDIAPSLNSADLTVLKNFNSLRACIVKVDSVIDPILTISEDIVRHVRENRITTSLALQSIFTGLTDEGIRKWAEEKAVPFRVVSFTDEDSTFYLIDGTQLLPRLSELHEKILYQQDDLSEISRGERERINEEFRALYSAGKNLLAAGDRASSVLTGENDIITLKQIIDEYDEFQKSAILESMISEDEISLRKKRTLVSAIQDFIKSLFSTRKDEAPASGGRSSSDNYLDAPRVVITKEARNVINRIKNNQNKIIPLSNYIELLSANDPEVENILNDIRKLNLKLVIPIYNARRVLYPNRSQQYLIPDIEYLLLPPDVIQMPETIRDYTDSLAGEKLKDEKMPHQAILNIEKYLMGLHTQKKSQMMRKAKEKK